MRNSILLSRDETDLLAGLIIQEPDHYTVLGVDRDAPLEVINTAYSRAVEHFHPLKRQDIIEADGTMQFRLSQAFIRLREAFVTLSSPLRRRIYDDKLDNRHLTPLSQAESPAADTLCSHNENSLTLDYEYSSGELVVVSPGSDLQEAIKEQDRRRVNRLQIRLPVLVTFGHKWQEVTETKDVSPLGIRLRLSHDVEPGTLLGVELPMPQLLRTHSYGEQEYTARAYVLYSLRQNGEKLVVMELI